MKYITIIIRRIEPLNSLTISAKLGNPIELQNACDTNDENIFPVHKNKYDE